MDRGLFLKPLLAMSLALGCASAALAQSVPLEAEFDRTLGTEVRTPQSFDAVYDPGLERRIAMVADGDRGRIGVYAIDLTTGKEIGILADQRFPMASTSKVAIAATFLAGVDEGKWSLTSEYPLPRRGGTYLSAQRHLDLMISKSCNDCTDALLEVVGGPSAVNKWMKDAGIEGFQLNRYMSALVREDGDVDPASHIVLRDSATPRAMGQLLAGIYRGKWLSAYSRHVLLRAMEETTTGKKRMPEGVPMSANLAHKTGTLSRTASDIGIFHTPDGRAIAAAIYVTGQSTSMAAENGNRGLKLEARRNRDMRIASIARALYDGYAGENPAQVWTSARQRPGG
ncbi:serine hydrolase [Altererythrobacter sp. MF3-039]|uniref:serine hydrolase n=1 Tax=Altererythrobacter sp. MF3-039 TaxID=3252901 RepID=UPI00390C60D0